MGNIWTEGEREVLKGSRGEGQSAEKGVTYENGNRRKR